MVKLSGLAIQRGAKSAKNVAAKIPTKPASTIAISELTTVPKISGSAPNVLLTGFHSLVHRNFNPKVCSDSHEPFVSMTKSAATITTKNAAAAYTQKRKNASDRRALSARRRITLWSNATSRKVPGRERRPRPGEVF